MPRIFYSKRRFPLLISLSLIAIALGSWMATRPASATGVSFTSPTTASMGASPISIVVQDFNRDGIQDVAVANRSTVNGIGAISVRLGNGSGGLGAETTFNSADGAYALASGDFNNDGNPDIVLAEGTSNFISLFSGDGLGGFTRGQLTATSPDFITTGDFNRDGNLDIVYSPTSGNFVEVLLGDGSGGFSFPGPLAVAFTPASIVVADFNRDGNPDLATASTGASYSILLGDGAGGFGAATNIPSGAAHLSLAVGDFNRDGNSDFVTANYQADSVSFFAGDGTGGFSSGVGFPVGTTPQFVIVGDFNNDGKSDVASANGGPDNVSILLGTGLGGGSAFSAAMDFSAGTNSDPRAIAAGDFDRNGKVDLATANYGTNNVSVLLNDTALCTPGFNDAVNYSVGANPYATTVGDFNGDGSPDLATANDGDDNVSVQLGDGDGTFQTAVNYNVGANPGFIVTGDFNRDGKLDLAVSNYQDANISVLIGNGNGTFQTAVNYSVGNGPYSISVGDFDHDGKPDLAVANNQNNNVGVLIGNGNGTFQTAVNYSVGTSPFSIASADLNGDGKLDLVTPNYNSHNVSVLIGNGDGTFQTAVNYNADTNPSSVAIGDFDRDGDADLAVLNFISNNVSMLLGNGNGTFQTAVNTSTGGQFSLSVVAGDFNGDGKLDLAMADTGNPNAGNLSVLLGQGNGSFQSPANYSANVGSQSVTVGDLNRDGKLDLITTNNTSGNVSVLLNKCPAPDLAITKTHTGDFTVGQTATYSIKVENVGNLTSSGTIYVMDPPPPGLTYNSSSGTNWSCSQNVQVYCAYTGTLAPSASTTLTINFDVDSNAVPTVTNTALMTNTSDINSDNDTATDEANVTGATTYTVVNTNDSGAGSLRQAILDANANAGLDIIAFNIPGSGVRTISPTSPLTDIVDPVIINGYTQPGSSPNTLATGNDAVILIEINGANAGSGSGISGLTITAGGTTVRGLAINRFGGQNIKIDGAGDNNVIKGCFIGTDPTGTTGMGNSVNGIFVNGSAGASHNQIGGPAEADRNLISGNNNYAILLESSTNNTVQNNYIGTDKNGTGPLPNLTSGIRFYANAHDNQIGGLSSAEGNLIAFNGSSGIQATDAGNPSLRNRFLGNSIHSNYTIGIELNGNGFDTNDAGDADGGANSTQNYPVLTSVSTSSGSTNVAGTLNSTSNTSFRVEFFSNPGSNPSTRRQGKTFLGFVNVTTDPSGNASVNTSFNPPVSTTLGITATATRDPGDADPNATSEFSNYVQELVAPQTFTVNSAADTPDANQGDYICDVDLGTPGSQCTLRAAIQEANVNPSADTITFSIGTGAQTISFTDGVPTIAFPVTIDGYTQPGASVNTLPTGNNAVLLIELDGTNANSNAIEIFASNCTVKGLIINRFLAKGILLQNGDGNIIQGNFIGTNAAGTAKLANNGGISINNSSNNIIGGTAPAARNLISGNNGPGIDCFACSGLVAQGNYIGTNAAGTAAVANTGAGLYLEGSQNVVVGGTSPGARNVISGNGDAGFDIEYMSSGAQAAVTIQGNYIGTAADGISNLGNGYEGILLYESSDCIVGGTTPGAGNIIAFSAGAGVTVDSEPALNNSIRGNSIHSNAELGIELHQSGGVTQNDTGDTDSGENNFQNFPVLTSATSNGTSTTVNGTLNSIQSLNYAVEFFSSPTCDPSGNGEGQTFLGSTNAATDANGDATFNATLPIGVTAGHFVTATATDSSGNTSEFSQCMQVTAAPAPTSLIISEFRLHGGLGTGDEFVELFNNSDTAITVSTTDGSTGWSIVDNSGYAILSIPNGTVIPARGHYLGVFYYSTGSSVSTYATPDANWGYSDGHQIGDGGGVAIFSTGNVANFTNAYRLDAVGFGGANALYREGAGLAPANGITVDGEYSFVRKMTGYDSQDTDNNASDFVFVSTTGAAFSGEQSILGAPGPENSGSPRRGIIPGNTGLSVALLDTSAAATASPNFVRDFNPVRNGSQGTMEIRRTITNNTGVTLTRLRFRVTDITTLGSITTNGADVRVLTSADATVSTGSGTVAVKGTTLEQPPNQFSNGGGLNSSLNVALPGNALANGASINVSFLLGVSQTGTYRFEVDAGLSNPQELISAGTPAPSIYGRVSNTSNGPATAFSNVTVTLSGDASVTTTTDANGNYSFNNLTASGNYTVTPSKIGYLFTPPSQNISGLSGNQAADFAGALPIPQSGNILISEFRFRGATGQGDEYVEIYNNTDAPFIVSTEDGSTGWSVVDSNGYALITIPNGTVIPARGHYLGKFFYNGSNLNSYAPADVTWGYHDGYQIGDDGGVAIFKTSNAANFTVANRLDAAGFNNQTAPVPVLYREGTGLDPIGPSDGEYAFVRRMTSGLPQDTDNNAADFIFVATTGGAFNDILSLLGAPGPEGMLSPLFNATLSESLIDATTAESATPNRVRDTTPSGPAPFGTLTVRRKYTNNTGSTITRLRLRAVDLSTLNNRTNTEADLRLTSSTDATVTTGAEGTVAVKGTTLEQPPTQAGGGGINSSLSVALPGGSLAVGQSVNVQFVMNVQQDGTYRYKFVPEVNVPQTPRITGRVADASNNGVSGVTITLGGATSSSTTTDVNGDYAFNNLTASGNYTVAPSLSGYTFTPASQTISNLRGTQTANFTATASTYTISGQVNDANNNPQSGVTLTLSGSQSATFPTSATGNYSFTNLTAGGNYTVTPSKTGYNFTPANQTFNNLSANQTANFILSPATTLTVTNTNDSGAGSLRQAITDANAFSGFQTITFNISGTGVQTITLASQLPGITDTASIDATTQPGYAGTPLIELNGNNAVGNALVITAGNSLVRGLVINRFTGNALLVQSAGNFIQGNYIGTNAAGIAASANGGSGIVITRGTNTIGATTAGGTGNLISGNSNFGIFINQVNVNSPAGGNVISGNYIGTNAAGTAAIPNRNNAIDIAGASNTIIGGATAGARNVISGNGLPNQTLGRGIRIRINGVRDSLPSGTIIKGNYIGTNAAGTAAIPNTWHGFSITDAPGTVIGGAGAGEGNLISGNTGLGIFIDFADNCVIQGNRIGTNAAATSGIPNVAGGVQYSARNAAFGGTAPGAGNVIAFNTGDGIRIFGSANSGNAILSNSIHSNANLGINLQSGANNGQSAPVITSARTDESTSMIQGTLRSTPNSTFNIQLFSNAACDPSGFGEGQNYLGSTTATTDSTGNATFSTSGLYSIAGQFITATATDASNNSSRFSRCSLGNASTLISGRVANAAGAGISNVTVTLSGARTDSITTDANGDYSFGVASGTYTVTASKINTTFAPPSHTFTTSGPTQTANFTATTTSGPGGKIVFARDLGQNNTLTTSALASRREILVMNADGSNQTFLTNTTIDNFDPVWSPDGTKIAFCSVPGQNSGNFNNEIWVMNADGTNQVRLTNNSANSTDDDDPAWSPDGTKIVFESNRDGGGFQLYVMNADGTGQTRLTNNTARDFTPSFSPDGTKIVFVSDRDGNNEIYSMNANGTGQTKLTNNSSGDDQPVFSPDGTKIAFSSDRDGNTEVYVMDANGSNQVRLTNNPNTDGAPSWSPDGTQIAFHTDRAPQQDSEIYVMKADGTSQTNITNFPNNDDYTPNWQSQAALPARTYSIGGQVTDAGNNSSQNVTLTLSGPQPSSTPQTTNTNANGNYSFTNLTAGGNYTVTPSKQGYSFTPANQTFNNLSANQTANFTGVLISTLTVTNTNDSGAGSLRQAILDSNSLSGTQTIAFNIPGTGVRTITLASVLPNITGPVIIDGTTQPGFTGTPLIELNGNGLQASGLNLFGGNSTVRGLVINRFNFVGIFIQSNGNTIQGNYLGTNAAGTSSLGNGSHGVHINGGLNNIIGGAIAAERNVISGNLQNGVYLSNNASNNIVMGNYIGTNAAGTGAVANGNIGVHLTNATNNTVGGTIAEARNIISGNTRNAIGFDAVGSTGNLLQGNYIGTNAAGTAAIPNGLPVAISNGASNNTIGGTSAGAGNVISGNLGAGVAIFLGAHDNRVEGNRIGTNAAGTVALGNQAQGVLITDTGSNNNTIGGTATGAGNTIAFNGGHGVVLNGPTTGNAVLTNSIHSNAGRGIQLNANANGVIANNNQAAPRLFFVGVSNGTANYGGTLTSTPNTNFTIQLFSNSSCDPSGFGEGQNLVGPISATTDAQGRATFSANYPATIGQFITATATSAGNNTSTFSQCVQAAAYQVGTFQFVNNGVYGVSEGVGNALITVSRTGDNSTTATVNYATVSGGTAVAGTDYTAASGAITFAPGENFKTFVIPLTNDTTVENVETVNMTISNPSNGSVLGSPTTATLSIVDNDPAPQAGNNGKIAFHSNQTGNNDIYVMNADGTNPVNITNNPGDDGQPNWSPDGTRIAFNAFRTGNSNYEIYVINADGTGLVQLTNNTGGASFTPDWSPDGTRIVFDSDRTGNNEIYVMNADGTNQTNLSNNPATDGNAVWSPDGTRILFTTDRANSTLGSNGYDLYLMNADGTNLVRLTNNTFYDDWAVWSPDGSKIAFQTTRDGNSEIYVMNADGTNQINLTNNIATDNVPAWSSDGTRIAFQTTRDGNGEIYVMNADGSNLQRLTNTQANDIYPDWQPVAQPAPPAPTYTISGKVADAGNNGIQNVTLTLSGPQPSSTPQTTTTDASGNYSFSNQTAGGNYTVTPSLSGYNFNPSNHVFNNLSGNQTANFTATPSTYAISGQVSDANNNPQSNVTISLSGSQSATTTTNATGDYSFANLAAGGNYVVTPSQTGYSFTPANQTFNNLSANQTANFTSTALVYTISGAVTDGTNPLSGVSVALSGSQTGTATTNSSGTYSFSNLAFGGNYTITPSLSGYGFTPQTFNSLTANQTANFVGTSLNTVATPAGTNVTVQVGSTIITFSQVTAAGTTTVAPINPSSAGTLPAGFGINGASTAFDITTTAIYTGPVTITFSMPLVTDPVAFADLRVLHGEGGALVDRTILSPDAPAPNFASKTVSARVTTLSPFVTATNNARSISGQVTVSGNPLVNATVQLTGSASGITTTDGLGNYSFNGLSQGGNYAVTPSKTNYTFAPASLVFNNLTTNQTGNFAGTLVNFQISGHVADTSGAPLSDVAITLSGARTLTVFTDASGNYLLTNVPASSDYTVTPTKTGVIFAPASLVFNNLAANQTGNFTGTVEMTPTPPPPPPSEDFDTDGPPNPEVFNTGTLTQNSTAVDPQVTVVQENGQLEITPRSNVEGESFNGVVTIKPLDLTVTPTVSVEAVQTTTGDGSLTVFAIGSDSENNYSFIVTPGQTLPTADASKGRAAARVSGTAADSLTLFFQVIIGGEKFSTGILYDPVEHRFWRFRLDTPAQTINFETSSDKQAWKLRYKASILKSPTALVSELSAGTTRATINPGKAVFDNYEVGGANTFRFSTSNYMVTETGGSIQITVLRTGSTESSAVVNYATSGGNATPASDFTAASGTIRFAVGESSKSFTINVSDDSAVEPDEIVILSLSNPVGGLLGAPSAATLAIVDDDTRKNPIDAAQFYFNQVYLDFFKREPEAAELQAYLSRIAVCGGNAQCIETEQGNIVRELLLSEEFQETGYLLSRFYQEALNRAPSLQEFLSDMDQLHQGAATKALWQQRSAANTEDFVEQFIARPAFKQIYDSLDSMGYVDKLLANAGITLSPEDRSSLVIGLLTNKETRASVFLKIALNEEFKNKAFDRTSVIMLYLGLLRRAPSASEISDGLNILKSASGIRALVSKIIRTSEYRLRFGAASTVQFSRETYQVAENEREVTVTVTRVGATDKAETVQYLTRDTAELQNCDILNGIASSRCDYITGVGTLRFGPGETSQTFSIPVVDDVYVEGSEFFTITLNATQSSTSLGTPNTANVTITDNPGEVAGVVNPIDRTDFFVTQQYMDFLGRLPEPHGFNAWSAQINNCAAGQASCDRLSVSQGIYLSPEFRDRGYFIYKLYSAAFGRKPTYSEFVPDRARVSGFQSDVELEQSKVDFIADLMARAEFTAVYNGLSNDAYVQQLFKTTGVSQVTVNGVVLSLAAMQQSMTSGKTRAQVLREVTESPEVSSRYLTEATIVMHYFGYLRRDPDAAYQEWIKIYNQTGDSRNVTNGFVNSSEYRMRFGK